MLFMNCLKFTYLGSVLQSLVLNLIVLLICISLFIEIFFALFYLLMPFHDIFNAFLRLMYVVIDLFQLSQICSAQGSALNKNYNITKVTEFTGFTSFKKKQYFTIQLLFFQVLSTMNKRILNFDFQIYFKFKHQRKII
jgi:hypothetical protein